MNDYIERDKLLEQKPFTYAGGYLSSYNSGFLDCAEEARETIKNAPAADVAPVRHGRWLTTDAYPHHLYCSVCYKTYAKNAKWVNELDLPTNYCPNCGCCMLGGGEDDTVSDKQ